MPPVDDHLNARARLPTCSARLRLAIHGCRCVRHVYGSPYTADYVFGTSTARHARLPTCSARLLNPYAR
ncbi:unnamed protein product [Heligmosomoides polygyrus]|uniref:Uncharacterized protein n=1 Tax=Heligmosomoides polygyrus TaxID=6339 RepID=A0A183FZP0_HELPZ|nr:unnamed protein product [Heligmosomoides polygyrus]